MRYTVVLTGSPGGVPPINELIHDPRWGAICCSPEAIVLMCDIHISPHEKPFQRVTVRL